MSTAAVKETGSSSVEEDSPLYFGEWVKRRRNELGLTQSLVSCRASCSVFTLRKIESGERRPSAQLAGLLANALEIPPEDQATFVKVARGELNVERLACLVREASPAIEPSPVQGNLPRTLTPFLGREPELTALGRLLGDPQCALLTIAGPGGIGKTRLAIATAELSRDLFPDGVWFVALAALRAPAQIVPTIAGALGFKFQDPAGPQAELLRFLRLKQALLVLDNAEHLLDGAGLFSEILQDCPQLKLLVTSRERLNLLSEWVFEIQGLPVPPGEGAQGFEDYSSVALFLQSARRVQAGFELGEAERRCVLRICSILEGMPLGIELAAAWVGMLPCEQIAREIERNLDFLSVSLRDLPERHRSLRATLDHSWALLTGEEKSVLARLAVFRGGFSREAAQEICGASLVVLSSLRNKSLLVRGEQELYSLHEIIRQYVARRLADDPGEDERVKDLHASYYIQRLAEWEKGLQSSRQLETFDAMALVIDNLSQAWRHMITHCRPQPGRSNQLCADLLPSALFSINLFYEQRCRSLEAIPLFQESVEYLQAVQDEFEGTEDCSRFLSVLGQITAYLGLHHGYVLHYEQAREYLGEALQLFEKSQSWVEKAQAQIMLASIDYRQGHYRNSASLIEQSRGVFKEAGESWWYLMSLISLVRTYLPLGKFQECEGICQEGFRLLRLGDERLALLLRIEYAYARYLQNDYVRAEELMLDNLHLSKQFKNQRMTANIYIDLSKVVFATHKFDLSEKYLQESIKLLTEFGESDDLAYGLLHLGKCFVTRLEIEAARQKFREVIKIGQALDMFYLVYWALANIARIHLNEGDLEKALEVSLLLRDCPVEYKEAQDEGDRLLADLQATLPEGRLEAALRPAGGDLSAEQAEAGVLAYAREHETR